MPWRPWIRQERRWWMYGSAIPADGTVSEEAMPRPWRPSTCIPLAKRRSARGVRFHHEEDVGVHAHVV